MQASKLGPSVILKTGIVISVFIVFLFLVYKSLFTHCILVVNYNCFLFLFLGFGGVCFQTVFVVVYLYTVFVLFVFSVHSSLLP